MIPSTHHRMRKCPLPFGSLCENLIGTVIPSEARNLALSIFNALRDSSSPAAPRNDSKNEFSHRLLWGRGWPATALSPAGAGRVRGSGPLFSWHRRVSAVLTCDLDPNGNCADPSPEKSGLRMTPRAMRLALSAHPLRLTVCLRERCNRSPP